MNLPKSPPTKKIERSRKNTLLQALLDREEKIASLERKVEKVMEALEDLKHRGETSGWGDTAHYANEALSQLRAV